MAEPRCIAQVTIDVGAADREFTFQCPFTFQPIALISAADAADTNDYFTPSMKVGSTTYITGTAVQAADAASVATPDVVATYVGPYTDFKVFVDFTGTAANVKGVTVQLWGRPRH